ncbi:hypothetical protein R3P38DRAFT_3210641 [Favolaschia claudopus]|uniref:Uncharacterized protein n=1 Tax=Favolaschia claudopus TaxID=2862362 RepID=A0AAW0AHR2_9AGAR
MSVEDLKFIRQAIADTKSQDHASVSGDADTRSSKHKSVTTEHKSSSACGPFIDKLPNLIDPTAPTEAVGVDHITSNFDAPAYPEVFAALAPLPPSMQVVERLINVHKQRLIAGVIKPIVAGQHLASGIRYQVEKRLYQKCLHNILNEFDADIEGARFDTRGSLERNESRHIRGTQDPALVHPADFF